MRTNDYKDLPTDYSKPGLVSAELGQKLLRNAEKYIALREDRLPEIGPAYNLERVERENKDWWPTHCEALRQGRGDLLAEEYARELVYFCADGPFYGRNAGTKREANWWAILAQPGVTWLRRGHRGACYLKCEQLTFYRDVYAPPASMEQIKRS